MLTQAEVARIVAQINDSFSEDRKRISKLEEQVKEITSQKVPKKGPSNG